jgi:hypothetical protein
MLTIIDVSPDDKVPNGSIAMENAAEARTTAYAVSIRWINHSFEAKLCKKALALTSIKSRFLLKKRSSSSKALIVIAPEAVSAT